MHQQIDPVSVAQVQVVAAPGHQPGILLALKMANGLAKAGLSIAWSPCPLSVMCCLEFRQGAVVVLRSQQCGANVVAAIHGRAIFGSH